MVEKGNSEKPTKKDRILSTPIVLIFVLTAVCVFGRDSFLNQFGIPKIYYHLVQYGVELLFFIRAIPYIKKKYHGWFIGLEVFFIFSYLIAYLRGFLLSEFILEYVTITLVVCIPSCICVASMDDFGVLKERLLYSSFFNLSIVMFSIILTSDQFEYSMPASYYLEFICLLYLNECFHAKKRFVIFYSSLVIAIIVTIFLKGARGPLLCIMVYLITKIFTDLKQNRRAMLFAALGLIAILFALIFNENMLSWISEKLNRAGLYSRSFDAIISKRIVDDSGRSNIYNSTLKLIMEKPILGYGPSSELSFLDGSYVHSLPLELIFDYGIIIGALFFLWISFCVFSSFREKNCIRRDLSLIFIINGYLMLFFSGTYLESVHLFIFLGIMLSRENRPRIVLYKSIVK